MQEEKEQVVFQRMRRGDERAFEYFFRKYVKVLHAYALGFLKEKEEAEDVVQEVFIYLWEHREELRDVEGLEGYLKRAVWNRCVNVRKREETRRRHEQEMRNDVPEADDWLEEKELKETRERLLEALEELPERCREIFKMSALEGMKYREIAERLDVTENTVKTQVKLGYKRMREVAARLKDEQMALLLGMLAAMME